MLQLLPGGYSPETFSSETHSPPTFSPPDPFATDLFAPPDPFTTATLSSEDFSPPIPFRQRTFHHRLQFTTDKNRSTWSPIYILTVSLMHFKLLYYFIKYRRHIFYIFFSVHHIKLFHNYVSCFCTVLLVLPGFWSTNLDFAIDASFWNILIKLHIDLAIVQQFHRVVKIFLTSSKTAW